MKLENLIIFFMIVIFSCATKPEKKEPVKTMCLLFDIPDFFANDEKSAYGFRYDYMFIEKNKHYADSDFIVAVRHMDKIFNDTLSDFTKTDQNNLKKMVKVNDESEWQPSGFKDKKINFISMQFNYFYKAEKIYQRSVYLECGKFFYIISLSSKRDNQIDHEKFDAFWKSIKVE